MRYTHTVHKKIAYLKFCYQFAGYLYLKHAMIFPQCITITKNNFHDCLNVSYLCINAIEINTKSLQKEN